MTAVVKMIVDRAREDLIGTLYEYHPATDSYVIRPEFTYVPGEEIRRLHGAV